MKQCPSPFHEIYIRANGTVALCCETPIPQTIHLNDFGSLNELFNDSDYYKTARKELDDRCSRCFKQEENYGMSQRLNKLKTMPFFNSDNPEANLKVLSFEFSNGCNLRCTMCSPHRSTGWFKDRKAVDSNFDFSGFDYGDLAYPMSDADYKNFSKSIPLSFIDENIDLIAQQYMLDISGGEPFFHPTFIHLLERLKEYDNTPILKIITNLTLIDDKILELLSHFKQVNIVASVDGHGDLYEYIRPSSSHIGKYNWDHIESVYNKLFEMENVNIHTVYAAQLINFYNIIPWIEYWKEKDKLNTMKLSVVRDPKILGLHNHPDQKQKQNLIDELLFTYKEVQGLPHVISALNLPYEDNAFEATCRYINYLDKHRNTSITKYVPEFKKYWIE